jgi:hypothetical protein
MMNRSRLVTNVTSKLSLRSNVNNNENECEKQKEVQLNFVHKFGFKIVKRQLVENIDLIHEV